VLANYKEEAAILRTEIDAMMNELMENVEIAHADCKPEIYKDRKTLKGMIKHQKDENEKLLRLVDQERAKTRDQRELVMLCAERILRMEE
jgi:hypothetical protein